MEALVIIFVGLFLMAAVFVGLARFARRRYEAARARYHAERATLVAEAERVAGPGSYVFDPSFSEILLLSGEGPRLVKVKRKHGGFEKTVIAPEQVMGTSLQADPVESLNHEGASLRPQHDRLLVLTLTGSRNRLTFYFETADTAREWLRSVQAFAALGNSGTSSLRS